MAGGLIYLYRKALSKERFKYLWMTMGIAAIAIQLSFNPEKIFGNHFFVLAACLFLDASLCTHKWHSIWELQVVR